MLIEPVGTIMSAQAQTIQNHNQQSSVEKSAEFTGTDSQKANKIDATTVIVDETQSKGQYSASEENAEQQQATSEQIKKAVENLNKKMSANSEAIFGIHDGTNRVTIKIVDKSTKEVIKELPPEKTLDMITRVWEMAGILVDEKR